MKSLESFPKHTTNEPAKSSPNPIGTQSVQGQSDVKSAQQQLLNAITEKSYSVEIMKTSLLDTLVSSIGRLINVYPNIGSEIDPSNKDALTVVLNFPAFPMVPEKLERVFGSLEDPKIQKLANIDVKPGDFVFVRVQDGPLEDGFYRGFVLAMKTPRANVLLIDFGIKKKVSIDKEVFALPPSFTEVPALAFKMFFPEDPEENESLLKQVAQVVCSAEMSFDIKIKEVHSRENKNSSAICILQAGDRDLTKFELWPWTSLDPRIPSLLGDKPRVVDITEVGRTPISDGDKVMLPNDGFVFDKTVDKIFVYTYKSIEDDLNTKVDRILQLELADKADRFAVKDPKKGMLVACYWTEAETYYRAEILSLDPKRERAKVRFTEYGNVAIEPYANLYMLPDRLAEKTYPVMAHLFQLKDVPAQPCDDKETALRMSQLESLCCLVPMTIRFVGETNNNGDDLQQIELIHPNGENVNKSILAKLGAAFEDVPAGKCDAREVGGEFNYDKCQVMSFAVEPLRAIEVYAFNVKSPVELFLVDAQQIGAADKVKTQIDNYAKLQTAYVKGPSNTRGQLNRVYLFKSCEDDEWYRGVCIAVLDDDKYEMFAADSGFTETVPAGQLLAMTEELMKIPFLVNQCIIEGFEDCQNYPEFNFSAGFLDKFLEAFPLYLDFQVVVTGKVGTAYVVKMASLSLEQSQALQSAKNEIELFKLQKCGGQPVGKEAGNEVLPQQQLPASLPNDTRREKTDSGESVIARQLREKDEELNMLKEMLKKEQEIAQLKKLLGQQ